MTLNTTATALVRDQHVPNITILTHLQWKWGISDRKELFRKAYKSYHGEIALESADEKGFIENHLKCYEQHSELPEYIVAMYFHLS